LKAPEIRTIDITRYAMPLREGGSLPGLAEANDGFLYVIKFRGAGQGRKALIAELIGGQVAKALGLRVPEIVFAGLDESFGRMEGDEEIQDLLKASTGLNLGLHFLSRAITFDPAAIRVEPDLSSQIVWLDSLLMNVDRTARNTNMLWWKKELWLIDHGAALYVHHNWNENALGYKSFPMIRNHVLLPWASRLRETNEEMKTKLTGDFIRDVVNQIPDVWLSEDLNFPDPNIHRNAYFSLLMNRLQNSDSFTNEARSAREAVI